MSKAKRNGKSRPAALAVAKDSASKTGRQIDVAALPEEPHGAIPLQWVDHMELSVRGNMNIATLRFFSVLPDRKVEVVRLQAATGFLEGVANLLIEKLPPSEE